ncbi:WD40/YVTN/BNR-like repeat-containing protein [Pseudomonas sp. NPDC087358]|uniref:WD40/YVTN/BNR-like repeat-containing protein n=1 Tax=Pseudomonas sp. NPDC087358 TaxID=3364439 RepID=UPI00384B09F4
MSDLNFHPVASMLGIALLTAVLGATVPSTAYSASADLLDTPASADQRAEHAVLLAVSRAGKRLVAVGERGIVLLSDDAGLSWRQSRAVPSSVALVALWFADERDGWAVGHGGVVLHSNDGGETWDKQLDGKLAAGLELQAAQAPWSADPEVSRRRLEAAGQLVADGADKPFLSVYFSNPHDGMVVGAYGLAMLTQDAGLHWRSVGPELGNSSGMHLYSILGDAHGVIITGEQGTVLRSAALGQSFTRLPSPYHGSWFGTVPTGPGQNLVFGLKGNACSVDNEDHWQPMDSGEHSSLTAGTQLADGSVVVASEGGRLWRSNDHGRHLQAVTSPDLDGSTITGVTQAGDGALVLSGIKGIRRLELNAPEKESRP